MVRDVLGSLLLLGGALWLWLGLVQAQRRQLRLLEELAASLEQMASAIRFRRETLLRLLAAQRQRPLAGPYYGAVLAALEEGISLPAAWRQGFAALSGEGGRILRRLEPEGDEQRILGELTWAAGELTELRRGLEQERRQREKLWFAGLFSGAGLLLILLILGRAMDVDLIFKIAAVGILVAVLNLLLVRSGREEQAMMTTLAGLVVVLMMLVQQISDLFQLVKTLFGL